jgi:hypothetical protein
MAYLDGIDYLENGVTPIEFQLIGVEEAKFTSKMSTIYTDTCPLVLQWHKNQIR